MQRISNSTVKECDVIVSVACIEQFCVKGYTPSITFKLNETITRVGKVDEDFTMVETDCFTLRGGAVTANLSRNFNLLRLRTKTDGQGGYYHPIFAEALSGAKLQLHITNHSEGEEYVSEAGTTQYYEHDCSTIEITAIQLNAAYYRAAMLDLIAANATNIDIMPAIEMVGNDVELKVTNSSSKQKMVSDIKSLAQASRTQAQAAATTEVVAELEVNN
jgi:hypothetical protein